MDPCHTGAGTGTGTFTSHRNYERPCGGSPLRTRPEVVPNPNCISERERERKEEGKGWMEEEEGGDPREPPPPFNVCAIAANSNTKNPKPATGCFFFAHLSKQTVAGNAAVAAEGPRG